MNRSALMAVACLLPCLVLGSVPARAQDAVEKSEKRKTILVSYGQVVSVEQEKVKSDAGSGAVLGGIVGAAATHSKKGGDQLKGAAAGALLGALLTRAAEGSHKVWGVTIRREDGATIKVLQDHVEGITAGACVSVEEGSFTNVRLVSPLLCSTGGHRADSAVVASAQGAADVCQMAKQALANAKTQEEFDLAMKKIQILCH